MKWPHAESIRTPPVVFYGPLRGTEFSRLRHVLKGAAQKVNLRPETSILSVLTFFATLRLSCSAAEHLKASISMSCEITEAPVDAYGGVG